MRKFFLLLIILLSAAVARSQGDSIDTSSCRIRISLLTCTPGTELYSTFGHSAIRIADGSKGYDIIFNYGTFDFDDPSFYSKFVRGKLLYFVSVDEYHDFIKAYEYEKRGITEQVLNLRCEEKIALVDALKENSREENKYYKYDFIYDNCTTRLRDIVFNHLREKPVTRNILPFPGVTYRDLIHEYLDRNEQDWNKFGIDILLGSPVDKKMNNSQAMFLPDYLMKGFDSTVSGDHSFVAEKNLLLAASIARPRPTLFTPFLALMILVITFGILSLIPFKGYWKFFNVVDFILFFIAGFTGIVLLFMWFGTDHQACRNNYNIAWALPTHFLILFFMRSKRNWVKIYFLLTAIIYVLLLISWKWLPQSLNPALVPFVGLLLVRSIKRSQKQVLYARKIN